MKPSGSTPHDEAASPAYEAPQLEVVLTPEELEREVHHAGKPSPDAG